VPRLAAIASRGAREGHYERVAEPAGAS